MWLLRRINPISQKRSSAILDITWEAISESRETLAIVTTAIVKIDLIMKFFLNDHMEIKKPKFVSIA